MEETNKVSVKIYGQEHIITGTSPREHIMKVADHVDRRMHDVGKHQPTGSASVLAVLTAVTVTDDFFTAVEKNKELVAQKEQLEKDAQHYVQLWEEAKKSFLQYKEDAQSSIEQKEELQRLFNEKAAELDKVNISYKELEEKYVALLNKNENLADRVRTQQEAKDSENSTIKELEARCKDMESSFFDLQMENIRLKGDLERYKKIVE